MKNLIPLLFLIVIFVVISYANSFDNAFVWDDNFLIVENPLIKSWRYTKEIFTTDLFYKKRSNFYRPFQTVSLMLDYSIWGQNPFGYHLTNLALHFLNAILVMGLVKALADNLKVALATALLFSVHPIQTEAVTYISGRADPLSTFFILIALLLFIRYKRQSGQRSKYFFLGSLIFFVFSLLSKESAIVFPLLIILVNICFSFKRDRKGRISKYDCLAFFGVAAVYSLLRITVLNFAGNPLMEGKISLGMRLLTTCKVIFSYLRLLAFPFNLHMERIVEVANSFWEPKFFISFIGLLAILGAVIWVHRYSRVIFFGALWFFVGLLPAANIVPINAFMAEHWLYLPSIGFFLIAGIGFLKLSEMKFVKLNSQATRKTVFFSFTLLLCFYSVITFRQNDYWQDELTFYKRTILLSPAVF